MSILSTLTANKGKIFYFIIGSFIACFALIYLRGYSSWLYDLCTPINPQLDSVQTSVRSALTGDPLAILGVIATPLTIIAAIVKIATSKITSLKELASNQVSSLITDANSQINTVQNTYETQVKTLTELKNDYENKFQTTFTELSKVSDINKTLQDKNASLEAQLKQYKEQLIAIGATV